MFIGMTKCGEKLKKYVEENGIRSIWLAEKLGISQGTLSKYLKGEAGLPKVAWKKLVILTRGKISMKALLNDFLNDVQEEERQNDENSRS